MSYTYLVEQAAEYSADCFSDIPPSALLKSIHIAERFYFNGNEMEFCHGFRSGTMCDRSMVDRGEELQILYPEEGKILGKIGKQCLPFWLQTPPVNFGMEHGMDNYMDQVEAIGNGQIPAVAAMAWTILSRRANNTINKKITSKDKRI